VKITNRARLSRTDLEKIEAQVAGLQSLSELLEWGRGREGFEPAVITDVVKQDECTQDAIVPWPGGRALVFGST
jgi:hypothetical protein